MTGLREKLSIEPIKNRFNVGRVLSQKMAGVVGDVEATEERDEMDNSIFPVVRERMRRDPSADFQHQDDSLIKEICQAAVRGAKRAAIGQAEEQSSNLVDFLVGLLVSKIK